VPCHPQYRSRFSELAYADEKDSEKAGKLNLLLRYDVVVVDEAHERTINTDFICGALKRIQKIRKEMVEKQNMTKELVNGHASPAKGKGKEVQEVRELKIVVMSATLDPAKFSNFFDT
jgi:ATP-dependent RNA helicase DHX33